MSDNLDQPDHSDDMSEYLQTFLDETEEQLDDLVETLLALEQDSTNSDDLNEAFRLIHSIKGSAGMMGFENIAVLTHHLENHFERFRSGFARLDEHTMNLVLRCVDFLRQCNDRLRDGEELGTAGSLLEELRELENRPTDDASDAEEQTTAAAEAAATEPATDRTAAEDVEDGVVRLIVKFRAGLQLVDLKAQLIVARLSEITEVTATYPTAAQLADIDSLEEFEIHLKAVEDLGAIKTAADVDGVESLQVADEAPTPLTEASAEEEEEFEEDLSSEQDDDAHAEDDVEQEAADDDEAAAVDALGEETAVDDPLTPEQEQPESTLTDADHPSATPTAKSAPTELDSATATEATSPEPEKPDVAPAAGAPVAASGEPASGKVVETMRVDIDRLDQLMNLAGELVVNRARFVQISGQVNPALRTASMLNRIRDFSDGLRRMIAQMESDAGNGADWTQQIQQLRSGLEMMNEQSEIWNNGRQCFSQMVEAIDQLTRVSHSMQRGVLDTRMVPVAPLFTRFKRVVRDLSKERGKQVQLMIRGEKTELDKRMIDELGEPLMHLIRNSLDHGLEAPEVRVEAGKFEEGTILLEATHSGNNVYIHVADDGAGISVDKIKAKLVNRGILTEAAAAELS